MLRYTTVLQKVLGKGNETLDMLRHYKSHYEIVIKHKDVHLIIRYAQIYHNPINLNANYCISTSTQNCYHIKVKTF